MSSQTLRYSLALLSIYEFREAIRWIQNPEDQEKSLDGILVSSGCSTTTSSENICAAYGRVMAWALAGLGLARLVCSVGSGVHVWSAGVLSHAIETCFWWKEYLAVASPRILVLASTKTRITTLLLVALSPPYTSFHITLLGPPLLTLWILLSYDKFIPGTSSCPNYHSIRVPVAQKKKKK